MSHDEYDVVVVGSGAGGGLAARALTERGARVLLLEAGGDPVLPKAAAKPAPPAGPLNRLRGRVFTALEIHGNSVQEVGRLIAGRPSVDSAGHLSTARDAWQDTFMPERQRIQSQCRGYGPPSKALYVDDIDHPYTTPAALPFQWIRGRQVGGRTHIWKRVAVRMTEADFSAPSKEGFGERWPLTASELQPYYEQVERILRVLGPVEAGAVSYKNALPARAMTRGERAFCAAVRTRWPDRSATLAPFASPLAASDDLATIDARINRRGDIPTHDCSLRHSIEPALITGRLTIQRGAVVREILLDRSSGRARGVGYVDAATGEDRDVSARVIVLAASALESTRILLNSRTLDGVAGLANSSGVLGCYLSDHIFGVGVVGLKAEPYESNGFPDLFVPAFRNRSAHGDNPGFMGTYQMMGHVAGIRGGPMRRLLNGLILSGQGETLPTRENRVTIDDTIRDRFGVPALRIEFKRTENDLKLCRDMLATAEEMAVAAGYEIVARSPVPLLPGASVHELGTARMGSDRKTSVVNAFCMAWDVPNVYVTDGACFAAASCQNPTLTIMALTARACDHILQRLATREL